MPSANETLIPDLDSTPGTTPPTTQGLHPSTATTKKKKKSKKNGRPQKPWDDTSEDTSNPPSVTPSPPVEHFSGVRLSSEPTPPNSEPEVEPAGAKDDDEDATAAAWEQTPPQPPVELELEEDAGIQRPELLVEDFDNFNLGTNKPEPKKRPPSPKPPPAPAQAVSSPVSSPRPRNATPAKLPTQTGPTPPVKRMTPPRVPDQDRDSSVSRPTSVTERRRTESTTQPTSPVPRKSFVEPANPPHMKQNHYFSVPGLDFGRAAAKPEKGGKQAGSEHYCCCFDSFGNAGDPASASRAKDALIVGWEGGLEVYRVLADKMEIVGRLEGLRGGVIGAKILPWSSISGSNALPLPLVALIVHGPMDGQSRNTAQNDESSDGEEPTKHYQTTVEVFSLQTQKHVSTLYKSLPVALPEAKLGQFATAPEPVGDLRVDAKGSFITISSGKSGEIFVFAQSREGTSSSSSFRCIGKYWTSLQSRFDVQPKPNASTEHVPGGDLAEPQTSPLLSLSGRWLAFVPPSSSSKISVQGTLALSEGGQQPPGVGAHLASPQPTVSCDIVGLNAEGVLAKYSRQAAQEFLKASRKGIEMGMAGWREFTQPSPPSRNPQRTEGGEDLFPPTNAPGDDTRQATKEPAVVAIMDLERLLEAEENHAKHLPPPLASFALDDGCNYLSLSEDGLRLLTTSRKGEVSYIWDLRYAAHGSHQKCDVNNGEAAIGPHVNRLQRIVRNSHAVVLDSAWARDGKFVALLTAHGTVHLHEISSHSQDNQRRRRRSTVTAPPVEKADATVGLSTGASPPSSNGFLGGIRSGWQTMSTQVSAMRAPAAASEGRATFGIPTTFAGFREVTNAGAAASGRAIARGLSQGYSVARIGAADVWHADDNKIKHKDPPNNVAAHSVHWLRSRSGMSIAVACGGKVFMYPIQRVTRQRGENTFSGLKAESKGRREFGLPPIATTTEVAQPSKANNCAQQGPHGFWGLRGSTLAHQIASDARPRKPQDSESDKAHYETNPPFCPLYIDRRVSMLGYNDTPSTYDGNTHEFAISDFQIKGHGFEDEQPWLFGESLPPCVKLNDRSSVSEASISDDEDAPEQRSQHDRSPMATFEAELDGGAEAHVEDNVQSRIMINPANNEIRINSRRKKPRKLLASKSPTKQAAVKADGDFELLEDDEEGVF